MNKIKRAVSRRTTWRSGRTARLSGLILLLALVGVSASVAAGTTTIRSTNDPTYGRILEGPSGHTLYVFVQGTDSSGTAHSAPGWPAMVASGQVVAASGSHINTKKLGTHKMSNGQLQVTYYGQPLYHYTSDTKAGQTKGENKYSGNGTWLVISTGGRPIPPPGY